MLDRPCQVLQKICGSFLDEVKIEVTGGQKCPIFPKSGYFLRNLQLYQALCKLARFRNSQMIALDLGYQYVQVSRISVVGLTYLAKSSLSVAVSRSIHDKYVRITKPHHSAKWLQHTSTVSGVICQKPDFRTFLPWSAHSAWHRL